MHKYIFIFGILIFSLNAESSTVHGAKIVRLHLNSNGLAYVILDKVRSTPCTVADSESWAIDFSTPFGELQHAHALSIYHTQSLVTLVGTGTCAGPSSNAETIADFQAYKLPWNVNE